MPNPSQTIGRIASAGGISPRQKLELDGAGIVYEKDRPRKDDWVIAEEEARQGEQNVEIEVEFAPISSALVGHPKGGCLENPADVEGNCHVRK